MIEVDVIVRIGAIGICGTGKAVEYLLAPMAVD
jgi:hypothetical protein